MKLSVLSSKTITKNNSLVIRQKGESQSGCFKKTKRAEFSKISISYPIIRTRTCAYYGIRNGNFGKFGVLYFLETPVLRFAFLPYYRRNNLTFTTHALYNNSNKISNSDFSQRFVTLMKDHSFSKCAKFS